MTEAVASSAEMLDSDIEGGEGDVKLLLFIRHSFLFQHTIIYMLTETE
jgi:hypothetical protein